MIFISKVISTAFDSVKRRIPKILRFGLSDVQTAIESSSYGIDSNPVAGMRAIYLQTNKRGKNIIIGYINVNQLADVGELRLYSTDSKGALKTYAWLKNDGTIELGGNANHLVRFEALKAAFDQFVSDYNLHSHPGNGAPPSTQTTADVSGAKINEIKTT